MADAPAELLYGYISGKFTKLQADSADPGDQPDMVLLSGTVQISASVPWIRVTISGKESTSTLQGETFSIVNGVITGFGTDGHPSLLASRNNPYISPSPFQYTARFILDGVTTQPSSVTFYLDPGVTVDLSQIVPVPAVSPVVNVVSEATAVRAETAAAEVEALVTTGLGPVIDQYFIDNPIDIGVTSYNDLTDKPTTFPPAIGSTSTTAVAGDDARLSDARIPTDGSVTNAKVSSSAAISADKLVEGTTNKLLTAAERTKIAASLDQTAVDVRVQNIVGAAPAALNTLVELATALGNDANYAATITTALSTKAPLASPAFTGTPTGITKTHVGLGNVDNTSDVNKPISTAAQTALDAKAPIINSMTFSLVATSRPIARTDVMVVFFTSDNPSAVMVADVDVWWRKS